MRPHLEHLDVVPHHRILQPQPVADLRLGPPHAEPAHHLLHARQLDPGDGHRGLQPIMVASAAGRKPRANGLPAIP